MHSHNTVFSAVYPAENEGSKFPPAKVGLCTTALDFLASKFAASGSLEEWRHRLANSQVMLEDGTEVKSDTVLQVGDCLVYTRVAWREPDVPNYFHVLYEDEHVLAVCKPSGLQVLPRGHFCQRTLMWLLQQYHQQHRRAKYPHSLLPAPVHRLGRGTSGVLLCACTDAARKQLSKDFCESTDMGAAAAAAVSTAAAAGRQGAAMGNSAEQRPLGKQYRALVKGIVQQDAGEVCVPIGLMRYEGLSSGLFAASELGRGGKPALSRYRVLHRHADTTLVEVTILTGRPHQIRIHMAALGHPLVGDPLYGPGGVPQADFAAAAKRRGGDGDDGPACVMPGDCGYHLHSMQLQFRHPATGAAVTVTAPVPAMLQTPQEQQAELCQAAS